MTPVCLSDTPAGSAQQTGHICLMLRRPGVKARELPTSLYRSVVLQGKSESPAEDYKRRHTWPRPMEEDLPGVVLVHSTGFSGGIGDAEIS